MARTRGAVNVILPERLFQRGEFLNWTYAQKWRMLDDLGIDIVFNLWHRADPDLSSPREGFLYMVWHCSPSRVPPEADMMASLVAELLHSGRRVLVHCEAGRGRSVWFATRVLALYAGLSRHAAFELVKQAVPGETLTPALRADLEG